MWMSADRLTHTVAVPDWISVVDVRISGRSGAASLEPDELGAVEEALEALEEQFLAEAEHHSFDERAEAPYVEAVPDRLVIRLTGAGPASLAASLAEQLGAQPLRWRYDYIEALRDHLFAVEEDSAASERTGPEVGAGRRAPDAAVRRVLPRWETGR